MGEYQCCPIGSCGNLDHQYLGRVFPAVASLVGQTVCCEILLHHTFFASAVSALHSLDLIPSHLAVSVDIAGVLWPDAFLLDNSLPPLYLVHDNMEFAAHLATSGAVGKAADDSTRIHNYWVLVGAVDTSYIGRRLVVLPPADAVVDEEVH